MAFLTKDDLKLSILLNELDEITREDPTIVTAALSAAEAEGKTYLFDSYDVDAIFLASGATRHQMVLQSCVDIAVYRIVAACQAGINPDDREVRYKAAINWFKAVKKTECYADLPRREETKQVHVRWGSNEKRSNRF